MPEIRFTLDEDDYRKLMAAAKLERRDPVPQAEVYVLEALKSWPKRATLKRSASVVTTAANGTPGD